jgi:hypothetical protein
MSVVIGQGTTLVRRAEWGARPPRSRTTFNPSFGSTDHWEGPGMGEFPHAECAGRVRAIQNFHMDDRGWTDIAYTAVVCPHGYAFEGRWIGIRTAANGTNAGNSQAYAVCYLGGVDDPFTDAAKRATRDVLDFLDQVGGAGSGRNCHRDWKNTQCPGDEICGWVCAGQPIPATPPTSPPPEDDDMPKPKLVLISDDPNGVVVLLDGRFWSWIRTGEALGLRIWFQQADLDGGQPFQMTKAQLLGGYDLAPGTDDPWTTDDESRLPYDYDEPIALPDGTVITLNGLLKTGTPGPTDG